MRTDYGREYISKNVEIFDTIEKILDSKDYLLKDIKKVLETECLESIRTVERRIKEATDYGASQYIKRRNLTKLVQEMANENKVSKKKIEKYNYKNIRQLDRLCTNYFNAGIDELVINIDKYYLQDKPTYESMYCKYLAGDYAYKKRILVDDNIIYDKAKTIDTRYMGRSGYIELEDGDKLNLYYFTIDMKSKLVDCKVDYTVFLRESELQEKIDFVYEKYKNKPIEIDYRKIQNLSLESRELLNTKIISFRHNDAIKLKVANNEIIDIVDFYPKAKLLDVEKCKGDIKILIDSMDRRIKRKIELDDIIVASGLEVIERIFRYIEAKLYQINIEMVFFMSSYKEDTLELHNLILGLSVTHISYMNNKLSKTKAKKDINELMDKIVLYKNTLLKLDRAIESEIFIDI
ncbi:MAG: hypothetical protein ACRCXT_19355 [Paraclostridium sp.]